MADLKTVLRLFARSYLGRDVKIRFRPSFFPFTEPSVEVDMLWHGGDRWVEMGGAGMVDPNVFRAVGYDPEEVTGFAFGLGIERLCMRRHGDRRHPPALPERHAVPRASSETGTCSEAVPWLQWAVPGTGAARRRCRLHWLGLGKHLLARRRSESSAMTTEQCRVIVATGATANSATVHHRDFPEIRAEGETPAQAATHLANQLTRALDSALTHWRRETIEHAITEIEAFVVQNQRPE